MKNFSNEEEQLTGMGELMWRASRYTMAKLGQIAFGIIDKIDTNAADRINSPLWEDLPNESNRD